MFSPLRYTSIRPAIRNPPTMRKRNSGDVPGAALTRALILPV